VVKPKPPLVISMTKDGKLNVDADEVPLDGLLAVVRAQMESDPKGIIQIRADRAGTYGPVIEVVDLLGANGFTHVALVSDPKSRSVARAATVPDARKGSTP